jgi:hypothetical protein
MQGEGGVEAGSTANEAACGSICRWRAIGTNEISRGADRKGFLTI